MLHLVFLLIVYPMVDSFKYGNELRAYQLEGLNWLLYCYYNRRCSILADEMGLGEFSFILLSSMKTSVRNPDDLDIIMGV